MRAIVVDRPGAEDAMRLGDVQTPVAGPGEILVRVAAAAVNRADLLQRQGLYPPPPGASPVLGLECAGTVAAVGAGVTGWQVGERAMALLAGGGYAEQVVVPAVCAMKVPARLSFEEAAAVPEVFLTVFLNLFQLGALPGAGWALVHGGGSGIGTAAIQMAKQAGAHVVVTAGTDEKCRRCIALGADAAINYRTGDFAAEAKTLTGGAGVDVVLDSIGASYLAKNLASLATGGRLVVIGLMGGAKGEISLGDLLVRRLSVIGSTLRTRPAAEKGALVSAFVARFGPALEDGRLRPVVDRVLPLSEAPAAHRAMKASEHFGKIVLRVA
ncbi:MAG: NAD(P)H-quinone oxidoreductase [Deltaproteobacteria bacterium]|nr:NAD(P)H-quinone oxidoreductase [Deltaproteobacteria bacterium]